ncbi:1-acyl-sn-glycerol-3-phosphate acyltransferase [Solirubrobacter sp. CPCC 204708]|uniref:1-acyl-sn-glycerol-3-phosphate acyltransferase n=1 Tax=Solirubrobacter deserti TaxID=2282478 RepID=A0ABT4RCS2_9ACTN|nr:lysophospholipid acyltransferase family protein [Solirubrobacter deserti]MBE2317873.1 1-acyl-sn-glycerol-3-phosphate acyltransferase [Solirubrobacter deserti]MDA0136350.1 1-acyl-sn-glycerol-3-phosphate acyltransferase [Solirubrobacter deserti]
MRFAQGGRRLEKLAGSNKSARGPSAPTKWRTLSAGRDPWSERGVEDQAWLREPRPAMLREIAQQTLLFPATRVVAMPTIVGAEDLVHAPQPAILAPNHESDIDTPLVLLALPHAWRSRTVVGAASDRFYRKRGFALAAGFWINTFPFDRGGGQRRGLAAAAAHLRDGRNVMLFPQGTRGAGPEGYRAGVAELALTAGVPIIPIHIEGSALVMPKGRGLNRRGKTTVTFSRPLQPRPGETPDQLTARLQTAIER